MPAWPSLTQLDHSPIDFAVLHNAAF